MANYNNTSNNTLISGSASADSIYNNGGNYVTINGGAGNDTITNYSYGNSISGYYGSYALIDGGAGNDKISLSSGISYSKVVYAAGDGNDTIYGLGYYDTLKLDGSEYSTVKSGNDLIISVGTDSILVKEGSNSYFRILNISGEDISNNSSNTLINGTKNDDIVTNYGSEVTIDAGTGNDTIWNYGGNNATIDAGAGNDSVYNSGDSVTIDTSSGNDSVDNHYGDSLKIDTGAGNDYIYNLEGNCVTINGGAGSDTIINYGYSGGYSSGSYYGSYALIEGGTGNDSISLSSGSRYSKVVYAAGDGNDTIYGLDSNDTLQFPAQVTLRLKAAMI